MKVTRRTFLKALSGATVAIITGVGVDDVLSAVDREQYLVEGGNLLINTETKTITLINGTSGGVTLEDFYRELKRLWDDADSPDSDVPMTRQTAHIFTMTDGYTISNDSAEFLRDGSLADGRGNLWTSLSSLGGEE